MSFQVESLFAAALGLSQPWDVAQVDLDTVRQRIDFEVVCNARRLACPSCGKTMQTPVPWARESGGFTLLFEALGLTLARACRCARLRRCCACATSSCGVASSTTSPRRGASRT